MLGFWLRAVIQYEVNGDRSPRRGRTALGVERPRRVRLVPVAHYGRYLQHGGRNAAGKRKVSGRCATARCVCSIRLKPLQAASESASVSVQLKRKWLRIQDGRCLVSGHEQLHRGGWCLSC